MPRFGDPEPLADDHRLAGFECGVASLDRWLTDYARQANAAGSARTYVVRDGKQGERVVGFYSLAAGSVDREEAIARAIKGMPRQALPAVLLARLGVDATMRDRGLGAWLLRDAMARVLGASTELGVRVMLVHAISAEAQAFYERFGFERSPSDPLNLQIPIKDVAKSMRAVGRE